MQNQKLSIWHLIMGILGILVFIGIIIWILWGSITANKNQDLLNKYGQTTIGVVTRINSGYRSKTYAVFEYYVNGKKYLEETKYYSSEYDVKPGARYEVVYYPNDPTIRRLNLNRPIINLLQLDSIKNTNLRPIK